MDPGDFIPLVAIVLSLGLAMLGLYFRHRRHEMSHRERMAAIEKNMQLPDSFFQEPAPASKTYLLRGIIWLAVGVGFVAFFAAVAIVKSVEILAFAALGLIPAGVGLAYLFVYRKTRADEAGQPTSPGSSPEASLRQ